MKLNDLIAQEAAQKEARDNWLILIEDCENRDGKMSEWEKEFIASIKGQIKAGKFLSEKQETRLDIIWEKVTTK